MSSWSMNDGITLAGAYTFTQNSAIVQGNSSADIPDAGGSPAGLNEIKPGDIVIDDNGAKVRVKDTQPNRVVGTSNVDTSANTIEITNHGFVANQEVVYHANGGTAIGGLTDGTIFFVKAVTNANKVTLSATAGGSVISLTGTGNASQTVSGTSTKAFTAVVAFVPATNSASTCTMTRPPISGNGTTTSTGTNPEVTSAVIDGNVLGITGGEAVAGVDNVTDIAVNVSGARYVQAPTVTVAAPTTRTIATAKVDLTANTITVDAGHNMRTGTKLTYTSGGTNMTVGGSNLADSTAVFVINTGSTTAFKIASSLSNAQSGTALDIDGAGNNAQTFVGDTATGTATISGGEVTGVTVTDVGSDYQAVPTVTVEVPKMTIPTSAVNASSNVITFAGHGLSDTDQITYNQVGGGTLMTNVTNGQTVFVRDKTANTFKIAATSGGTAINIGTGHDAQTFTIVTGATQATAVASQGLGQDGDSNISEIAHVGWVKKTVGTGGRAGRVHYETLVAASSIRGDAEDIATPDS